METSSIHLHIDLRYGNKSIFNQDFNSQNLTKILI